MAEDMAGAVVFMDITLVEGYFSSCMEKAILRC
jgi:hypothetical protein